MTATYELDPHELDMGFIEQLKNTFRDARLKITVREKPDATDYLMATKANRDALEASLEEYRAGKVTEHELYKV